MSKIDDGGPVYPNPKPTSSVVSSSTGITRRDWLAGLAMQGLIACKNNWTEDVIANGAYELADAMIAEGRKE